MERATLSGLYAAAHGRGELRLDVDGRYPQRAVSGTIDAIHWIAHLEPTDDNNWSGEISYTDGATASFPYTSVGVRATESGSVEVDFDGPGEAKRNVAYERASPRFRTVNFEFDSRPANSSTSPSTRARIPTIRSRCPTRRSRSRTSTSARAAG